MNIKVYDKCIYLLIYFLLVLSTYEKRKMLKVVKFVIMMVVMVEMEVVTHITAPYNKYKQIRYIYCLISVFMITKVLLDFMVANSAQNEESNPGAASNLHQTRQGTSRTGVIGVPTIIDGVK